VRVRTYLGALLLIAAVIVSGLLLIAAIPFLKNSIWTLIFGNFGSGGSDGIAWPVLVFIALIFVFIGRPKAMRRAAKREEVQYRVGSEDWSAKQRAWSCVRFGFAHVWNIVVPFAFVVSLMGAGGYFMVVYLQTYRGSHSPALALEAATDAHVAYNRIFLGFVACVITAVYLTGNL